MMMKTMSINKHVPLRTCIACRKVKKKREMVRLVRSGESVVVDNSSRQPGRGAYLCRRLECWQSGLASNQLEYTLKIKISKHNRGQLTEYGMQLNGGL
jgi:predicted RNA-binding protein YlxR (DUF448 family)